MIENNSKGGDEILRRLPIVYIGYKMRGMNGEKKITSICQFYNDCNDV